MTITYNEYLERYEVWHTKTKELLARFRSIRNAKAYVDMLNSA